MLIQRDILDWRKRYPDCYLNDKKEKRSEGLASFVEKIILDSNESIKSNQGSLFNNLSKKQRSALERFEADQNIVIMPPDKDSSFIILNKNDYKKVCLKTLCNRYFYEELKEGPSASYKDRFTNVIQKLLHDRNSYMTALSLTANLIFFLKVMKHLLSMYWQKLIKYLKGYSHFNPFVIVKTQFMHECKSL